MSEHHEQDINDLGLQADLTMWQKKPVERRRILKMGMMGIGSLLASVGLAQSTCVAVIPEETAGPYPADGSSGMGGAFGRPRTGGTPPDQSPPLSAQSSDEDAINVLTRSGVVRQDITTSLETGNRAEGVPTTLNLQLVNVNKACAPLAGYAIYVWHCDALGEYSMYSSNVLEEDYLRGVQETDENGMVSFKTIFPACYVGRWPHVHFEIYPSIELATSAANKLNTSQLAIPQSVCEAVYNTVDIYSNSIRNLAALSLATDNVFSDGYDQQLASVTGSIANGYSMTLQVGVSI